MNRERIKFNLIIALEAVKVNKLRSLLTALGIIFGVAAVISMLSIGKGAQLELLEQIKLVGANNINIAPRVEQEEKEVQEGQLGSANEKILSNGLSLQDVKSIQQIIPGIEKVSPEIVIETSVIKNGIRRTSKVVGVTPAYFEIGNFQLFEGNGFSEKQLEKGLPVCIIGFAIKSKFFPNEDPVGKVLKCGNIWLRIVGVLSNKSISKKSIANLGIRDYNMDIYVPIKTVLMRFENRSLVTKSDIKRASSKKKGDGATVNENPNYHQIDRLVVQVKESSVMGSVAEILSRMLERRHNGTIDFEIEIPELLLKQQQRTNDIFNYVLGAIAGISLLVGGIGIMNIMLASVMERIKEIGLRLALGAKKNDIVCQFLFESTAISIVGGVIGVALGISLAFLIGSLADLPIVISIEAIFIAFTVATSVGLIFGIAPARKAARQDPITSLRHE